MTRSPILIVDDQAETLAALRQILTGERELVFARSGHDALAAARVHRPALILLDIHMPEMDGYEVCRALKAEPAVADIPVIFVTMLSDVGNEAAGFEAGAVDYIVKPLSPEIVLARVRTHLSLVRAERLDESYREALYMLANAGHYNDTDTGIHIWRMGAYAAALAKACGWPLERVQLIEMAAPLHDTGKIGVSDRILQKPGRLDHEEWEIMKTHTRMGHDILSRSHAPGFQMAADIALYHHEQWDGSGYPCGLKGQAIPESARITAVADVFDALTMKRPYKEAWSVERAMDTLRQTSGSHFEPRLVACFEAIFSEILDIKRNCDSWPGLAPHNE